MAVEEQMSEMSDLRAYVAYVEHNLERIERGGWTPVCFAEFMMSEERDTFNGVESTAVGGGWGWYGRSRS